MVLFAINSVLVDAMACFVISIKTVEKNVGSMLISSSERNEKLMLCQRDKNPGIPVWGIENTLENQAAISNKKVANSL